MDYAELQKLHAAKLSNREIARRLKVHHRTVASHLGKIGLGSNSLGPRPINIISGNFAKCSKCGEIKPLIGFAMNSSRACARDPYYLSFCKACSCDAAKARLYSTVEGYLADKHSRFRRRAKRRGLDFRLDSGFFLLTWKRQRGFCFYTDTPLTFNCPGSTSQVSADRIDVSLGYIPTNVVLCCDRVNKIKNDMTLDEMRLWTPEWFRRVVAMWREEGIRCAQVDIGEF